MAELKVVEVAAPAQGGFAAARHAAEAVARAELGECTCMAFYDRLTGLEAPAHVSECHGDCQVPGWEEYALTRGATLKVVVNGGDYVFLYRSVADFGEP